MDRGTPLSHASRPFDERSEDQGNEEFFQEFQEKAAAPKKKASKKNMSTQNGGAKSMGKISEQRPTLPQINEESLRKYKEFEKWQTAKLAEAKNHNPHKVMVATMTAKMQEDNSTLEGGSTRASQRSENAEECLSEDIYSLIYTANICSQAFYFALFVFAMQETLLLLILWDLVDLDNWGGNALGIPAGVPLQVNIAQAISMVLIVVTILGDSGDLTNGIGNLIAGYDRHVLAKNPHANCCKWFTAFALQTLAGLSMAVVLFFLVMQSTNVLGLALNFAALTFIYEIDNITFEMSKHGFLTRKLKSACERVNGHVVPRKQVLKQQRLRKVMVVLFTISLIVPFGLLVHNQWDSKYLCSKVFIQFNGESIPDMVYYTGNFIIHKSDDKIFGGIRSRIDDRVYYKDEETNNLILAYCNRETAWTISINGTDHCSYLYKSSTTRTFDVTDLASSTWYAWDFKGQRAMPVNLYLRCDDCDDAPRGNCHANNGQCVNNECVCSENRMGHLCDNVLPACGKMRVDTRTNELPFEQGIWFTDRYELLYIPGTDQVFQAQKRPVYVAYYYDTDTNGNSNETAAVGVDFMFFNGRRWVIIGRDARDAAKQLNPAQRIRRTESAEDDDSEEMEALLAVLGSEVGFSLKVLSKVLPLEAILDEAMGQNYTNDALPLYRPFFFSEVVNPLGENDKLDPVGLGWFAAQRPSTNFFSQWRPDESRPLMSTFLCSECNDRTNPCMNSGVCKSDSTCECNAFFASSMCERTLTCHEAEYCLNNGICEQWNDYCTCSGNYFGSLCQYERLPTKDYIVKP